jgi:hypothetical protein
MRQQFWPGLAFALATLLVGAPWNRAPAQGDPPKEVYYKWSWEWTLKDGRTGSGILTMYLNGTCDLPGVGSGTWSSEGNTYTIDWGRGKRNEDKLTLSSDGKELNGNNPFTKSIKGTRLGH